MKLAHCFLAAAIALAAALSACGGGGEGAPGTGIDSVGGEEIFPSISLPAESPNPELFGVWTFKVGAVTKNCGPELDTSLYEQEIRIIPKEAGCSLSGEDETGNLLHAKLFTIFDVESTICNAGGDTLVFENTDSAASRDGSDCSINFRQVARFTRSGEILEGSMVAAFYFEGSQCTPSDVACSASIMILASKGRHVDGGIPYLSPPAPTPEAPAAPQNPAAPQPQPQPQPGPAPAPQPAPQQPAPVAVPPGVFNEDAIRRLMEGLPQLPRPQPAPQPAPAPEEEPEGGDNSPAVPVPPLGGGLPVPMPR